MSNLIGNLETIFLIKGRAKIVAFTTYRKNNPVYSRGGALGYYLILDLLSMHIIVDLNAEFLSAKRDRIVRRALTKQLRML